MEYNTTLYKVFKWIKGSNDWKFVRTFYSFSEASRFCNSQGGSYTIQEELSYD